MGKRARSVKKKSAASRGGAHAERNGQRPVSFRVEPVPRIRARNDRRCDSFDGRSVCGVYKCATENFKEKLARLVPGMDLTRDVRSLMDAVDRVQRNGVGVSGDLVQNLRTAIRVRSQYSSLLAGGDDRGHAYFLLVLNYCLQILQRCERRDTRGDAGGEEEKHESEGGSGEFLNRFEALSVGHDHDEVEPAHDDSIAVERPPAPDKAYSYKDLSSFPDSARCMMFYHNLAFYAADFSHRTKQLKETLRAEASESESTTLLPALIYFGIFASTAIRDVDNLENQLYAECPGLEESPHRIIVWCFMWPLVPIVSQQVRRHSPLAPKFEDEHALAFVADITQALFGFNYEESGRIAKRFQKKWRLPKEAEIENTQATISLMVLKNTCTSAEAELNPNFRQISQQNDETWNAINKVEWYKEIWDSIGRGRSILNTMKILECFRASFMSFKGAKNHRADDCMRRTLDSPAWNETDNPARSIRGDLDSVLLNILCAAQPGGVFPMERNMLPVGHLIRRWIGEKCATPPRFALTFALHLVLQSVFELQGDGDIARIESIAKSSYARFMSQTEEIFELGIPLHSHREKCLKSILELKRLTETIKNCFASICPETVKTRHLLCWNPLSAALLAGYLVIYVSLEGGLATMTTGYDLNVVLHLYNALKAHGLVNGNLPVLSDIDQYFSRSKCVWNGWNEKSQKGKFTYRFYLSMGLSNELASWYQEEAEHCFAQGEAPRKDPTRMERAHKNSKRISPTIYSEDISATFSRHCLCNFEDMSEALKDADTPDSVTIDPKCQSMLGFESFHARTFLLYKSFKSELASNLLKYNMVAIGTVLSQFLCEAFSQDMLSVLQTKDIFHPVKSAAHTRDMVNTACAKQILGGLDYSNNLDRSQDTLYTKLGETFEKFFCKLDMDRVSSLPIL